MSQVLSQDLQIYKDAYRKGTEWILQHVNDDGSIGPLDRLYYYRVPWAMALVGEVEAAGAKLDWISRHMLAEDGAFEGQTPRGMFVEASGSYPVSNLIEGAVMLRRFDVVYRATKHLLSWQDQETGGFFETMDRSDAAEQVLYPTAQGGMTLVLTGHLDVAKKTGEWFNRMWQLQPDVKHKLYSVYSREQGLVHAFPADKEASYVTKKDEPWQHHFNGGIAATFLTKLYLATGDDKWLELAREYQNFSMTTDDCQFKSMQVCKSSWGAGLLYLATDEEQYRDWIHRMGAWCLERQLEDGHWENTKFWTPNPTLGDKIEITTEFVMHLVNIVSYLGVKR